MITSVKNVKVVPLPCHCKSASKMIHIKSADMFTTSHYMLSYSNDINIQIYTLHGHITFHL